MKTDKIRVLFICVGNSARSQMAEGLFRKLAGDIADVFSAGTDPADDVHPLAKQVMAENEIDISGHRPKELSVYLRCKFDVIVTTCDRARESCPSFPGDARKYHWELDDPAAVEGDESERLTAFRRTFSEIMRRVPALAEAVREMYNEKNYR